MVNLIKENAKWIYAEKNLSEGLFRQSFDTQNVKSAKITFAVLGIYEAYMNNQRIGEDYFMPLSTDFHYREKCTYPYHPRKEVFDYRMYCTTYDITNLVKDGKNTLAVVLAGGWYSAGSTHRDKIGSYGDANLAYVIEIVDKDDNKSYVYSGQDAKWQKSFIKSYRFYNGESHDYSDYDFDWKKPDFDDSGWKNVSIKPAPETNIYPPIDCPPDRIIRTISPKLVHQTDDIYVYDCSEIITGVVRVKCTKDNGSIKLRYDEGLDNQARAFKFKKEYQRYEQASDFENCKKDQIVSTLLTWHCFRYFEVEGDAEIVDVLVIHSDVAVTSEFECSDKTINWIYKAFINTQLANMHAGVPSDCPHIERKGYTGDGQLACDAAMTVLDAKGFYHKWLQDISDCQDRKKGSVQYTAPFHDCGGGPGGWGGAIAFVPYVYYKHYGDKEILKQFYPKILHWFKYLDSNSKKGIIVKERKGVGFLGDWCVPGGVNLGDVDIIVMKPSFVNTYFYVKAMQIAYEIEEILGIDHSKEKLAEKITQKKADMTKAFFDEKTGNFFDNKQGANALAADIGLGDERTYRNMVERYASKKSLDTGIFGTDIVIRLLMANGNSDLAIDLLTSNGMASFARQMNQGYSTLWEHWGGYRSHCHPMFGAVSRYLFEYVLGIRMVPGSVSYDNIVIDPKCMAKIPSAHGKITTPHGEISVCYDTDKIEITVPDSIKAKAVIKGNEVDITGGKNTFDLK